MGDETVHELVKEEAVLVASSGAWRVMHARLMSGDIESADWQTYV